MSAQKVTAHQVQLGRAPSTISAVSRPRTDEIGATAAEPTTHIDDGDDLNCVFPFPFPDSHLISEMQSFRLGTYIDGTKLVAICPLADTGAARPKAAFPRQQIHVKHPIGVHRFACSVLPPS
jgi:hypothetical protein